MECRNKKILLFKSAFFADLHYYVNYMYDLKVEVMKERTQKQFRPVPTSQLSLMQYTTLLFHGVLSFILSFFYCEFVFVIANVSLECRNRNLL